MHAKNEPLPAIINGTTQFVVPVFQRDYSWTEGQCEQLWQDIMQIARGPSKSRHFFGSIVNIATDDSAAGFTRWLLIDGQQRLTTLTLLLVALRDYIKTSGWKGSNDGPTVGKIDSYFLKNVKEKGPRKSKLVLRRHDQATLSALVYGRELPRKQSIGICENYEMFRERMEEVDPEAVYRGINRLVVVDVTLNQCTDDPQLIFESLNSTGVDLSQSDLIRNFILMRLSEPDQTRLYESYWSGIESLFRGSENTFDAFIRDFLALRTQATKQERSDQIYAAFRRQFANITSDLEGLEDLLRDILRLARYYAAFGVGAEARTALVEPLARLRRLVDVPGMLVTRLFDCFDREETLTEIEFLEALDLLESYVLRRAVCGLQTRGYWLVFARLAYRVSGKQPLRSLKAGLALQPENYAFPSDSQFREALENTDIYHKRFCRYLLDRLENCGSRERTDTRSYSVEHILPQNEKLRPEWREMLGEGWEDVHREWVDRLGNLTLTGYNSTYSDRPFEKKKNIAGGFKESSVRLNKSVRDERQWTQYEIEKRGKALASRSLDVWPQLRVEQSLIDAEREAELRDVAAKRDVGKVPMSDVARQLFDLLRDRIQTFDSDAIEIAEKRSVSYHGPTFFLEVVPRKSGIVLLLELEFNEVEDSTGLAKDTTPRKFIQYAKYNAGVYVSAASESDIESTLPMIYKAHALART